MLIGDFAPGDTLDFKFTTIDSTGAPIALAGTPAASVYKDNSTTQSTTGVTLTASFDGVTGLNHIRIDTSADGTFYSAAAGFQVVLTAGTVDSVSVVGYVVAAFTLTKAHVLRPTIAGRTLDVTAGGAAGIDWANVEGPTTEVSLSATTIKGLANYANISNVTLHAGTHSGATVQGVTRINSSVTIANGAYSAVSVRVEAGDYGSIVTMGVSEVAAKSYSGVTIQGLSNYANISNVTLHAGTHSGATVQGLSRINSSVTIADAEYSAVTVRLGLVDYSGATVGAGNITPRAYSGVSVEITTGGIQAASLGAASLTAAAAATDLGQEIADRFVLRSIAGGADSGRSIGQALAALRNRIELPAAADSTGTVYGVDDSTSMWTFSVTTTDATAIRSFNPGGGSA